MSWISLAYSHVNFLWGSLLHWGQISILHLGQLNVLLFLGIINPYSQLAPGHLLKDSTFLSTSMIRSLNFRNLSNSSELQQFSTVKGLIGLSHFYAGHLSCSSLTRELSINVLMCAPMQTLQNLWSQSRVIPSSTFTSRKHILQSNIG